MAIEWLEPSIEKRITDISNQCCEDKEIARIHEDFTQMLNKLKLIIPKDELFLIFEIESAYNVNSGLVIGLSYRTGLDDGMKLSETIQFPERSAG